MSRSLALLATALVVGLCGCGSEPEPQEPVTVAPSLLDAGVRVVDLSGAFRLRDGATRAQWYPATGELPPSLAYGLTEFELDAIRGCRLLSNPAIR